MKFTILTAIVATLSSASTFLIVGPVAGSTVNNATTVTIAWQAKGGDSAVANVQTVVIDLMGGDSNNLQVIEQIATNLPNTNSYQWRVPADVPSGSFAIKLTSRNATGTTDIDYSSRFTVVGGPAPNFDAMTSPNNAKGYAHTSQVSVISAAGLAVIAALL